ncbi:nuclear transport factor 2 family protein [Streptomyces sp. BHT-5-2]|uniref:nuclear transport factor 2 family protein n=1 Tax=unclassified Streptomyces TaxID=2593676 RepID=UPI001C8E0E12|nr:nuclear transport factor 2 family protein [Streptomyces sp. BHT-5-2]QZL05510.1 nuclear transport factor 2 family protein [Streptomyces sp. BHT-5-2]
MQSGFLKANKELVAEFIRLFYNEKDFDRARALLTEDFTNHHPGAGVGPDRTIDSFREHAATPFPDFALTIHRVLAEGDQVWTHGVVRVAPDAPPVIVVDLWRIADGRLAEHWDVGQAVPEGTTLDAMIADAR